MKRQFLALLTALFLLGALAGCRKVEPATATPATEPQATAEAQTDEPSAAEAPEGELLSFSTTDLNGETVNAEDFRDAKLLLINFWEPWCGPCVGELPDLARLYETYRDRGLVILGVFGDMEDEAKAIVAEKGVSYPVLHLNGDFSRYLTEYVPTTVLFDGDGVQLLDDPMIGSHSYEEWEQIVLPYLED